MGLPGIGKNLCHIPYILVCRPEPWLVAIRVAAAELTSVAPPCHIVILEGFLLPGAIGALVGLAVVEARAFEHEVLLERDGAQRIEVREHVGKVIDPTRCIQRGVEAPVVAREVEVEHAGAAVEHIAEVDALLGIPGHNAVNALQAGDVAEHGLHSLDSGGIPTCQLRNVVERGAAVEHEGEVEDGGEVPTDHVLQILQARSALEHTLQRGGVDHRQIVDERTCVSAHVEGAVPCLQTRNEVQARASLALVGIVLTEDARPLGSAIRQFGRQRAEETFEASCQFDLHVSKISADQVLETSEPVFRVHDVEIAHEFDVLDLIAGVGCLVVARDVNEPRQFVPFLGDPRLVVGVVIGVVVQADDERARVGHELPPCETVGREDMTTGLLNAPDIGEDQVLRCFEDRTGGVDRNERVGRTEPSNVAAMAGPTTVDRAQGRKRGAAYFGVAERRAFKQAVQAHDDLVECAIVCEHVGGDDIDLAACAIVHLPIGEVDEVQARCVAEHARKIDLSIGRSVLCHHPESQCISRGKAGAVVEHIGEVGDLSHIPACQVVSIHDACAACEHVGKVLCAGDLPSETVGHVEAAHVVEHVGEVDDLFHVPVGERGERGKSRAILERVRHIGNVRGDPGVDTRNVGELVLALEEVLHAGDMRSVDVATFEGEELDRCRREEPAFQGFRCDLALRAIGAERREGKAELVPRHEFVLFSNTMCPAGNVLAIDFCGPVVHVFNRCVLVEHADGEHLGILVQEPPNITV